MEKEEGLLEECPNCGSNWGVGSEEFELQCCDCCGYPDFDDEFEEDIDCDYFDFDDYTPEE